MGIPMSVDVRCPWLGPDTVADAIRQAFTILRGDDQRFSPFRDDSELSRVNRGELHLDEASTQLHEVLAIGMEMQQASAGAFSCRSPAGLLDTNGVVKGWSVDRAARSLLAAGLTTFCFNAGGDVVVRGEPEPGRGWQVGVRSPDSPTAMAAVLAVRDRAVATSGSYERGKHIWDGRTGRPASGLSSVTVLAEDLTRADVLATTVCALGPTGVRWAAERYSCIVLAVSAAGEVIAGGDLRSVLATEAGRAAGAF
jgi:thiamine biosynthesis lipoprotein